MALFFLTILITFALYHAFIGFPGFFSLLLFLIYFALTDFRIKSKIEGRNSPQQPHRRTPGKNKPRYDKLSLMTISSVSSYEQDK